MEWVIKGLTVSEAGNNGQSGAEGRVLGMSFREGLDGCVLFFLLGDPLFACLAAKKERIEDAAALEGSVRGMVGYWEAVLVWEVSVVSVPLSRDGK